MKKHLIFHFCVNQETGWAKAHIDRLKQHIDLFDGYRFFSICEPNNDLRKNSLIDERSTALPSANLEYGVSPEPFSCNSRN